MKRNFLNRTSLLSRIFGRTSAVMFSLFLGLMIGVLGRVPQVLADPRDEDREESEESDVPVTPALRSTAGAPSTETCNDPQGCDDRGTDEPATCQSTAKIAKSACLTPGPSGMDAGQAAMYTMMMNQVVAAGTQIAAIGKNAAAQCKLQSEVQGAMGTINTIKATACGTYISKCEDICEHEAEDKTTQSNEKNRLAANVRKADTTGDSEPLAARYEDDGEKLKREAQSRRRTTNTCRSYSSQVVAMGMGAVQNGLSFAINKQCAKEMAATAMAVPTYAPITLPTVGDCTDPNNQSMTCYCANAANSKSPMCAGFSSGGSSNTASTTAPLSGAGAASPYASTAGEDADGNTVDPFAANGGRKSGGDGRGPGDGGSGAPGAGGISALGSEGGGGGAGADPKSAITGTSGGTGGGLGGSGGSGGGSGGLARNGEKSTKGSFMDRFNLKKFLPGSKYKTRGIAGMSVKSVDGITGPMGPSLFEKATRQYQQQIEKQNVILEK